MESVSFQLPAGFEKLRKASAALRDLLIHHNAKEEVVNSCELALQELLVNIAEHSYSQDESRFISVNLRVVGKRFFIETEDSGVPANVNLEKVAMPDPLDLQVRGYGMALIMELMDYVDYQYRDGKNLWVLSKAI
ncbi:MAG: ATP-binding protein [Anaerolineales bacterium]